MGKRELVLILIFAAAGVGVWRLSAPSSKADDTPFSFATAVERLRARLGGNRASARVTRSAELTAEPGLTTLVLPDVRAEVTVVGEARATITAELEATVTGPDDAAAQAQGRNVVFSLRQDRDRAFVDLQVPRRPSRRAETRMTLRVPSRMAVETTGLVGTIEVSDVAGLRVDGARAQVRARRVTGGVTVTLLVGDVDVDGAREVRTDTRRAGVRLARVTGGATLTAVDGRVVVGTVDGEVQIDSTRADVDIDASGASALRVTSKDARVAVTWPGTGGATLDVSIADGPLTVPTGVRIESEERRKRATGPLSSAGPTLAIDATRGSVSVARRARVD